MHNFCALKATTIKRKGSPWNGRKYPHTMYPMGQSQNEELQLNPTEKKAKDSTRSANGP